MEKIIDTDHFNVRLDVILEFAGGKVSRYIDTFHFEQEDDGSITLVIDD